MYIHMLSTPQASPTAVALAGSTGGKCEVRVTRGGKVGVEETLLVLSAVNGEDGRKRKL